MQRVATQAAAAQALKALGVRPDAEWQSPVQVYSQHRETAQSDYYYVHNPTAADASFDASFEATGRPVLMDAWTGRTTPLAEYCIDGDRVIVPLELEAGGSQFIAFRKHDRAAGAHIVATDAEQVDQAGVDAAQVRDTRAGTRQVTFSNGVVKTATLPTLPAPIVADSWNLSVAPVGPEASKPEISVEVDGLPDWRDVPQLVGVSGTGTYRSTVTLPAGWTAADRGTYLDVADVQGGSVQVYVNDRLATPNTNELRRVDVSDLVRDGDNAIKVVFASTVRNKRIALYGRVGTDTTTQAYGIRGPVTLTPYARATVTAVADARPPVDPPRPPVGPPRPPARRPSSKVTIRAAKAIRLTGPTKKGLLVKVTVPQKAKLALTLSAKLPRAKRAATLVRASRSTTKAATVSLRLKAGGAAARKLKLALKSTKQVTATVAVKTTLAGGKPATKTLRITIRR